MGTPEFAVVTLDAIVKAGHEVAAVVTVPDKPAGRGQKIRQSAVKIYAEAHGMRVMQPEKLREECFVKALAAIGAEIFVVVAFRMLPEIVWSMPPRGTFNLHASLLPQYRGAAPINWAIINGEKETGVTTFMLNERIDEGAILQQRRTAITESDTAETLHDRLAEMGAELVTETLREIAEGKAQPKAQSERAEDCHAAPKIYRQDCCIDWDSEGEKIYNKVRGLSPYPTATMQLTDSNGRQQSIKIYETTFTPAKDTVPGTIDSDNKKYLRIGAKDGYINILSLQLNGKRRNSVEEFLRGYNISDCTISS